MIPDETFDDLRAAWDYSGGASGSYWHILKHAELGKFDLSAMKRSISQRIAIFYSDLGYSIDDESERVIVLDLRDRMRTECLIAPLSMQERRDWMWVDIAPSRVYRQKPHSSDPSLRTNNIQNRAIASYLASRHPEAIRYIRSVRKHNRKLPGYNGGDYNKYIVRQLWNRPFLEDAACAILGVTSKYAFDWTAIEEIVLGSITFRARQAVAHIF